ncbi:hypothetical protein Pelo_3583 [Pelomyxa schiedti]|nr:hypothetical protein Pelo_3583 [Pelomyxa schiedti]
MSDPWPHSTRDDCPDCVAKLPVEQQRGRIKDLCRRWTCETLDYDENEALGLWIHYFSRALCGCDQRRIARLYIECGILPVLCKSAQSQEETIPHTCFNILFRLIDQNLLNQGELLELLGPLRVLRLCEESITVPGSLTRTAAARLARQLFHLPITSEKCSENFRPEFVVALLEQIQRENIPFLKAELIDGYYGWELEGFYRRLPAKYYEACLPRYMCMQHETYALTWTSIFMAKEKDSTWLMDVVNRFPHFISGLVTCASFLPFPALPNCSQQSIALYVLDVLLYMTITPTPILQSTDTNALCTNNVFSKCPDIVDRLVTFLDQLVGLIRSGLKSHIDTLFSKLDQVLSKTPFYTQPSAVPPPYSTHY